MSLQQVAARALAAVEHARSLFAVAPAPVTTAGPALEEAAQSTTDAGRRVAVLSGELIDRHRTFVDRAAGHLTAYAQTDTALQQHLRTAAMVTQSGARQLDTVVARTRAIAQAAATARTPAAQRAVVQALQTQVAQADSVVTTARQRAAALAGQIRALNYGGAPGRTPAPGGGRTPKHGGDKTVQAVDYKTSPPGEPPPRSPAPGPADKDPWQYPWDPPPPPDSAPGGGRWEMDTQHPYESGSGGGPPIGPIPPPRPWHTNVAPVTGGTSGLKEVVPPSANGWGVQPAWTLQEGYRFRVVGEGFDGAADHLRWVQRDGMWYQSTWVGYDFEAEHVRAMVPHNSAGGYGMKPWGMNRWDPIGIHDIYKLQVDNPRLPLYLPNPFGGTFELPAGTPGFSAGG